MVRKVHLALRKLRNAFGAQASDAQLDAEIREHLDSLTDHHRRRGLDDTHARVAARRDFGGVEQMKEQYRDQRGLPLLDALVRDVRYTLRSFRKNPGFVCAVVLSLAAGIGANAIIFTVFNAVLLTSLPVRDAQDLVAVSPEGTASGGDLSAARFSYPVFDAFRRAAAPSRTLAA